MLTLDPYSESVLFQCDRCRVVGELFTHLCEEEGTYHCWSCLRERNRAENERAVISRGRVYEAE